MDKTLIRKIMYYAGTVLLFLVLAYGFVPEVLTGKVVIRATSPATGACRRRL